MNQKVLIVDDHALVRAGLRPTIQTALDDACDILEADSLARALEILEEQVNTVDLVLLDLTLPDAQGLVGLERIREKFSSIPIAILSAQTDTQLIQNSYRLSISGFIIKSAKAEIIVSAVRLILSGGIYIPPEILNAAKSSQEPQTRSWGRTGLSESQLTPRQQEVLHLITKGASNQEISDSIGATIGTVKSHVVGILRALGVNSRTQAISLVHDNPTLLGQNNQFNTVKS